MRLLVLLLGALISVSASANGQSTHLWITQHALTHLADGDLRDLLNEELRYPMLMNGSMFPDGGYAIFDDYGELAHWERFQTSYLDWIVANEPPPFSDSGSEHVAFLMGLASHGMADQVFDSLFMERSKIYDNWGSDLLDSLDTASDVIFVAATYPQDVPLVWAPNALFVDLYDSSMEYEVTEEVLEDGQTRLAAALVWVALVSQNPEIVEQYQAQYPWAAAHLFDETTPGSPPCEGEIIAGYWQSLWTRLHGGNWTIEPVLATFPLDGYDGHPTDPSLVESRLSVVFSRAPVAGKLGAESFSLVSEAGEMVPVSPWLFYGSGSNVVHLSPEHQLAKDTVYTLTVKAGLEGRGGLISQVDHVVTFRTLGDSLESEGCGCRTVIPSSVWWGLLLAPFTFRRRAILV